MFEIKQWNDHWKIRLAELGYKNIFQSALSYIDNEVEVAFMFWLQAKICIKYV